MKRPGRKMLARLLVGLLLLLLVVVLLLGIGLASLLGTQNGRLWLLDTGLEMGLGDGPLQVTLEGARSPGLDEWSFDRVLVTRQQEIWLDVHQLRLQWRPKALLQKNLIIESISARQLDFDPSAGAPSAEPEPQPKSGPIHLPSVAVQSFELGRFRLIGDSAEIPDLHIAGDLRTFEELPFLLNLRVESLLQSTQTPPWQLLINSEAESSDRIRWQGSLREQSGGWLSQQLGLPADSAIDAGFRGAIEKQPRGYSLSLHQLQLPFLTHNLGASGQIFVDPHIQAIQIDTLVLTTDDRQHRLTGSASRQALDLQLTLNKFPLDLLSPWLDLLSWTESIEDGSVSAKLHATGTAVDPQLSGQLSGSSHYKGYPVELILAGDFSRQQLNFEELAAQFGTAGLQANGRLDLQGAESDLAFSLQNIPSDYLDLLESFKFTLSDPALPADLKLRILSANGHLTGDYRDPTVKLKGTADGSFLPQEQPQEQAQNQPEERQAFTANLDLEGNLQRLSLTSAVLQLQDARAEATGIIDIRGDDSDLRVTLDSAPLSLLELAGIELPSGLLAEISGSASLKGALPLPQINSELQVRGRYQELPFALIADGSFINKRLQVNKLLLDVDGTTALEAQGFLQPDAYDLRLTINDLPRTTLSALGWNLVTGDFNGSLHVQGTPAQPSIEGHFFYNGKLTGLDLSSGEETVFELGWRTQITTQDQVLTLVSEFSRDQLKTGEFQLSLPISDYLTYIEQDGTGADFPLAFNLDGALDLAILNLVLDPDIHRISGRAALRLDADGTLANPQLAGTLELLDTRYENTLSGTLLSDVQLLLKSSGTRVNIIEANARSRGSLEARGYVDWARPDSENAVNIEITANNAALLEREDLNGEVSGEISLTGSFTELWLKGILEVTPFAANIDLALQSQIPEIDVIEIHGDPEKVDSEETTAVALMPAIKLDLRIKANQQAYLRGRGLEAELAGEIHLSNTLENPHFAGEFSILRGEFEVFGRKFELLRDQGEVIFANNALYLFIPAEHEMDEYTIRAELSGTVESLSLSLSSVPDLPEDEILSQLIFGKSAQNITPFQAIRLAGAIQTLRSGGGFNPIGSTRDALGVDTLSIESATTDAGTGVSVGVGKYINERVYLEVTRTPNEIQPWQGSIEIELSPRLHLKSTTGGDGRTGAELLWKRDF